MCAPGIKLLQSLGGVLHFEIYQSTTTPILPEHKDVGIGRGIVISLADTMLWGRDCVSCFDRFFHGDAANRASPGAGNARPQYYDEKQDQNKP